MSLEGKEGEAFTHLFFGFLLSFFTRKIDFSPLESSKNAKFSWRTAARLRDDLRSRGRNTATKHQSTAIFAGEII